MNAHFPPVRWPRETGYVTHAVSSEDYRPVPVMAGLLNGAVSPGRYSSVVIQAGPDREMETGSLNSVPPVMPKGFGVPLGACHTTGAAIGLTTQLEVQFLSRRYRIQGTTELWPPCERRNQVLARRHSTPDGLRNARRPARRCWAVPALTGGYPRESPNSRLRTPRASEASKLFWGTRGLWRESNRSGLMRTPKRTKERWKGIVKGK